jgi:hypothetical protein
MKKILFALALIVTLSLTAGAQNSDAFVNDWENISRISDPGVFLVMPNSIIGDTSNSPAPLGSGLLVLTALGGAYAVSRKRKNN